MYFETSCAGCYVVPSSEEGASVERGAHARLGYGMVGNDRTIVSGSFRNFTFSSAGTLDGDIRFRLCPWRHRISTRFLRVSRHDAEQYSYPQKVEANY